MHRLNHLAFDVNRAGQLFGEPVEFDLERPDLLVELRPEDCLVLGQAGAAVREYMWRFSQGRFLPLRQLIRMPP
jgi:hypothetical protein